MSSAYVKEGTGRSLSNVSKNIVNNTGPKTEPCTTPDLTGFAPKNNHWRKLSAICLIRNSVTNSKHYDVG